MLTNAVELLSCLPACLPPCLSDNTEGREVTTNSPPLVPKHIVKSRLITLITALYLMFVRNTDR